MASDEPTPSSGGKRKDTQAAVKPLRASSSERSEAQPNAEGFANSETLASPPAPSPADSLCESDTLAAGGDNLSDGDTLAATGPVVREGQGTGRQSALLGRTIADRYTIIELLGKGGMSEVYLARHELLKKNVAVKVLKEELASSKAALERFHREAIAAAAIGDPHIVDVTDYGFTKEGDAFIAMERLEGMDLRKLLRGAGALPAGRAVAIARQILRGLRAAHQRGIIHRDLKAENVFLTTREDREFVKLLDFGISKLRMPDEDGGGQSLTSTGMVMGTPQYIAPEQAHAQSDLDHRVDIYAMGVILYEMLVGELPFSGDTALELMMKHVQEVPEPPRQRRPDLCIPPELEEIALKALAKDREDRFPSAQAMLDALPHSDALSGGYQSIATSSAPLPRAPQRSSWPAIVGGLVLLIAGAGFATWRLLGRDGRRRPGATQIEWAADQRAAARHPPARDTGPLRPDSTPPPDAAKTEVRRGTLDIVVEPRKAKAIVKIDGKRLARPWRLGKPFGSTVSVKVMARGYLTQHKQVKIAREGQRLSIRLVRARRSGDRRPGPQKGTASGRDTRSNPYR